MDYRQAVLADHSHHESTESHRRGVSLCVPQFEAVFDFEEGSSIQICLPDALLIAHVLRD